MAHPHPRPRSSVAVATAVGLGSISAIHVLWGRGSTFPFRDRQELNDQVVGQQVTPSPASCYAVAGVLAVAAVSVERAALGSSLIARLATVGCSVVLGTRAVLGFIGRTDLAVPGSTSAAFRRNDRRVFAPLCAALASGAAIAAIGVPGRRS
jgi:Protein of unknown function (DUF3995)